MGYQPADQRRYLETAGGRRTSRAVRVAQLRGAPTVPSRFEDPDRSVKIIKRYVLKEHVGPFFFSLTALTSLMMLQYIARRFGDLVGKGLGWRIILDFFVLSIPFTVAMTFPMAVLLAVLYAFSRLGAENEITALRANGVSSRSLINPVLAASVVLAIGMLWFNDQVLPKSNHRLATLTADIFKAKPTLKLREGVMNPVPGQGQLYLRATTIDAASSTMRDVAIEDLSDPARRRTLIADSGRIALAPNQRDLTLTLYHGVMISIPTNDPGQLSRLYYGVNRIRVADVINKFQESLASQTEAGDREIGVCQLQQKVVLTTAEVRKRTMELDAAEWFASKAHGVVRPEPPIPPDNPPRGLGYYYCTLSTRLDQWITTMRARFAVKTASAAELSMPPQQVPAAGGRAVQGGVANDARPPAGAAADSAHPAPVVQTPSPGVIVQQPTGGVLGEAEVKARVEVAANNFASALHSQARYLIELHKKFALAAACVVLALVGAPLALRFPRGGVGFVLGTSFVIFAIYYVFLIGGESLANKGYLIPWVSMWMANMVFLVVGVLQYTRVGRESATARGRDARSLFAALGALLKRGDRQADVRRAV